MNIYGILKRVTALRSPRLRLAMFWAAHVLRRRNIGIYLDPVLACNLRCRMCAFSDESHRRKMHGRMTDAEIDAVARGLMPRALKVQIGCGAEPTLDRRVAQIIAAAKKCGVPYVSVTTNGQLLTREMLSEYASAGLDELTLSLHGTTCATYEWLMDGASFDRFMDAVDTIRHVKSRFPSLRLRVNYTVNADNVSELSGVVDLFGTGTIDLLQVRPVQKLGDTAYDNFDLSAVSDAYVTVFEPLAERCSRDGIELLMPSRADLAAVATERDSRESMFEQLTYCYVGPGSCYCDDYDPATDDYASFHRRRHTARRLLASIFSLSRGKRSKNNMTKKLNYHVRR